MHACMLSHFHLCLTLCDPVNCSPPGSSVHGILHTRILEWVAISFSRGSSQPKDQTHVSYVSCIGRQLRLYSQCICGTLFLTELISLIKFLSKFKSKIIFDRMLYLSQNYFATMVNVSKLSGCTNLEVKLELLFFFTKYSNSPKCSIFHFPFDKKF